ncbi:outer membrane beta-barrel protein [Helicobacter sp. 11S02629-2]|uniref:outer membrane beta-barrel protein n=1 Tax=Helicobacter sp. 11S02629-2 TaxID=1476195 RepID=UPI000BA6241E|nr:outer membrane beta-barrel protein [Helicobacter sp. 11S02629-2]PAF44590.1 hypothetical protein BKH40_04985 [Helicobacter sp. 11S02629-2]
MRRYKVLGFVAFSMLAGSLLTTTLSANSFVLGLRGTGGLSGIDSEYKVSNNGTNSNADNDDFESSGTLGHFGFGVKAGYEFNTWGPNQYMRVNLSYDRDYSNGVYRLGNLRMNYIALNIDYKYTFLQNFGVFGGFHMGYLNLEIQNSGAILRNNSSSDISNISNIRVGGNNYFAGGVITGFTYSPLRWLEFELFFKTINANFDDFHVTPDRTSISSNGTSMNVTRQTIDLSSYPLMQLGLGVNFKF